MLARARELISAGDYELARGLLAQVVTLDPDDPRAYLLSAYSFADSGGYEEALRECERALSLDPLMPGARYVLGIIHQRRGDTTDAVEELKKTIYVDPDFVLANLSLGNIYKSQAKWDDACRAYENALRSIYSDPEGAWTEFMGGFKADLLAKTCERSLLECRKAMEVA
jgi:chemotaxis protein methyltransferase CheR